MLVICDSHVEQEIRGSVLLVVLAGDLKPGLFGKRVYTLIRDRVERRNRPRPSHAEFAPDDPESLRNHQVADEVGLARISEIRQAGLVDFCGLPPRLPILNGPARSGCRRSLASSLLRPRLGAGFAALSRSCPGILGFSCQMLTTQLVKSQNQRNQADKDGFGFGHCIFFFKLKYSNSEWI